MGKELIVSMMVMLMMLRTMMGMWMEITMAMVMIIGGDGVAEQADGNVDVTDYANSENEPSS
jgi:hypothetical protein